jgi:hypothetical protein
MLIKITTTYYRPDTSIDWWVRPPGATTREEEGLPPLIDSSIEISSDGLALTEIVVLHESWLEYPRSKSNESKTAYYGEHDGAIFRWERLYELLDESGNVIKAYPSYRDFRAEHPKT